MDLQEQSFQWCQVSDGQRVDERENGQIRAPNGQTGGQGGVSGGANSQQVHRYYESNQNAITPPLQTEWNWNSRPVHVRINGANNLPNVTEQHVEYHDETNEVEKSDDELLSDEYDSYEMPKIHEEQKKYM